MVGSVEACVCTCVDRKAQWIEAMARFSRHSDPGETSGGEEDGWRRYRRRANDDGWRIWRLAERMRSEETRLQASREACFRSLQEKCQEKESKARKYKERLLDVCHRWKQQRKKREAIDRENEERHKRELELLRLENQQLKALVENRERELLDRESKLESESRNLASDLAERDRTNLLLSQEVENLQRILQDLRQQENASKEKLARTKQQVDELQAAQENVGEKEKTIGALKKRVDEVEQLNELLQRQRLLTQPPQQECSNLSQCGSACKAEIQAQIEQNSRLENQNQKLLATISVMRKEMEQSKTTAKDSGNEKSARQELEEAREHLSFSARVNATMERDLVLAREQVGEMARELTALRVDRDKLLELSNRLHAQLRDSESHSAQRNSGNLLHRNTLSTSLLPPPAARSGKTGHAKPLVRNYNLKDK